MNLEEGKEYSVQLIICPQTDTNEYCVDEIIRDALYEHGVIVEQSFDYEEIAK